MVFSVLLGSLDLNDHDNYVIDDTQNPGTWRNEDSTLRFQVTIRGDDQDDIETKRRAIINQLNRSQTAWRFGRESERVALALALNTTEMVYFDVRGGTAMPARWHFSGRIAWVDLVLICDTLNGVPIARLDPDVRPASGVLTNGAAKVLIDDVGGDYPARTRIRITDESTSGVINRLRLSLVSAASAAVGDWSPWLDIVNAGSSNQSDFTAFGSSYERLSMDDSADWIFLGRAVLPSGKLNRGWRSLYLRMRDHAAPIGAPSNLDRTSDEPTAGGEDFTQRQTAAGDNGSGATTAVIAWPSTTLSGSLLALQVKARGEPVTPPSRRQANTAAGTSTSPAVSWPMATITGNHHVAALRFEADPSVWTAPGGWTVGQMSQNPGSPNLTVVMLYRENHSSTSGSQSMGSFSSSTAWSAAIVEYEGVALSGSLVASQPAFGDGVTGISQTVGVPDAPAIVVSAVGAVNDASGGPLTGSFSGLTSVANAVGHYLSFGESERSQTGNHAHGFTMRTGAKDVAMVSLTFKAVVAQPNPIAATPPAGYALGGVSQNFNNPARPVTVWQFYRQNAPATGTGNQTVTFDRSIEATWRLIEFTNFPSEGALIDVVTSAAPQTTAGVGPSEFVAEHGSMALVAFGAYGTGTTWSSWGSGATHVGQSNGLSVARAQSFVTTAWSMVAAKSASDASAQVMLVFQRIGPGDAPGTLIAGTYAARIEAVDLAGNAGAVGSFANITIGVDSSAMTFTWDAPAATGISHYRLSVQDPDGAVYRVNVGDVTGYRLATLAGLEQLDELPSGSGTASAARIQVQVGTSDMAASTAGARNENFEVIHTGRTLTPLLGDWHMVPAGAGLIPPQQEMEDGAVPDGAVEVFGKSSGGPDANLDIDALMLASDESGMTLEYPGLDLATAREWVVEVRRDGSVVAWLEDGAGNFVGQVSTVGRVMPAAGDNILSVSMESADGVALISQARCTVEITMWPVADWLV